MEKSAVLCNLSQHKYVRGSAVQEKFERHRLSISHLLLAHICWSTEPVSQMKDATCSVTRSPWVGSRFEITTMDKLRPDIEWKDVTEAAMERLTDLWEGTDQ
ncbi:uncharacterized protein PHACADRAFT_153590 [Phanerochaete carnosa HHB-10118-sp]|uniref:Uncharacterized protein n=1 Tax=Phanerochaete carnosa (strain HHB-10118-sp) TaxID=650164 RepID=K5VG36_PHACS|nr:uncharacterized protein PHACADRAFT_153590 [Phanerochaete carnosa HHB-10118-sp]EKM50168.1 hypothetical protein PHACADRAFT_153590 [Phanerochaete carnosa HHB-10118-sp]